MTRMGARLWQVEMGEYTTMAAALPAVNMGEGPLVDCPLEVEGKRWQVTCIGVGNPHCVTVVPEVDSLKLEEIGPAFENHPNFPERINTEFVEVVDATHLKMRVWGGAAADLGLRYGDLCHGGGLDRAGPLPGRGGCACGPAGGGELIIRVLPGRKLLMTGAAVTVYEGVAEVSI